MQLAGVSSFAFKESFVDISVRWRATNILPLTTQRNIDKYEKYQKIKKTVCADEFFAIKSR